MLAEAQDEEELAAIWIAATAKELEEHGSGSVKSNAYKLHLAACDFLKERFYLWHHAAKRLVPNLMIPFSVLEAMNCEDAKPVIGLIQMNTVMLKGTSKILRYSSLGDKTPQNSGYRLRG